MASSIVGFFQKDDLSKRSLIAHRATSFKIILILSLASWYPIVAAIVVLAR